MDNELIVTSIKNLCKNNNITVGELEKKVGLSQGLVSKWKEKTPSLDKIVDIADYFHVSLDEVVGYNSNINDDFLKSLIKATEEKSLRWEEVDIFSPIEKLHNDQFFDNDTYTELQYYSQYKNSYFTICCFCKHNDSINPIELNFLIQPSKNTNIIHQKYSKDELKPLWIKILKSFGENIPDELKVEDLKNSFIHEFCPRKQPEIQESTLYSKNVNQKEIKELMNFQGYILYNIYEKTTIFQITSSPKKFYQENKKSLGKVREIAINKSSDVVLISESYIMKLSDSSNEENFCEKWNDDIIWILNDAGFDMSDFIFSNKEIITLYPIK